MTDCEYILWGLLIIQSLFRQTILYNMEVAICYSVDGGVVLELSLEEEIELMREAMVDAADRDGLTADATIEFSRKLDNLINQFDRRRDFY